MAQAEILTGTIVPFNQRGEVDTQTRQFVTNSHITQRSIDNHERRITDASEALELAVSGLTTAIDKRKGVLEERTTTTLEQSTVVKTDLGVLDTMVSEATTELKTAQDAEYTATQVEAECKDAVLETTVRPLRQASEVLFARIEDGSTGDIETYLLEEYKRLGQLLGIQDPTTPNVASADKSPASIPNVASADKSPASIAQQLIDFDIATEELITAITDRKVREKELRQWQSAESAVVEVTTPVLQEMSDHEKTMNHLARLIDRLTVIADVDQATLQKIKAILVTLWLVLSEPRTKSDTQNAYVAFKEILSDIDLEPNTCEEIEQ